MTDKERIDLLEEMMSKGENILFRNSTHKDGPIGLFTIVTQHIHGTSVRGLLDYVAGEWVAAGRKPDPWAKGRKVKRKEKGAKLLSELEHKALEKWYESYSK